MVDPHLDQSWRAVPVPWQKRWGRRLFYLILLAGIAVVAGLAYEPTAEAFQLRNSPPPGRVVQADGLDMHMQVAGPPSTPVVVLFNGWGLPSASWSWVYAKLAETNMVVRWDPPGYAWSAIGTGSMDASSQVDRIYKALKAYDVSGPYLVVGTGLGAVEARVFAAKHKDEVAGAVLIDTWHPSLMGDVSARADALDRQATLRRFSWHRFQAWWTKAKDPDFGLPPQDATVMIASMKTMKLAKAQAAELRALPQSLQAAEENRTMDQKPFWVLTSAALDADGGDGPWSPNTQAARQQLDEQLSKLSLQGKHLVIPGATPATLICHQDLADQVVDAVRACTSH